MTETEIGLNQTPECEGFSFLPAVYNVVMVFILPQGQLIQGKFDVDVMVGSRTQLSACPGSHFLN